MTEGKASGVYLKDIPKEEAWSLFTNALTTANLFKPLEPEIVNLDQAMGRITAEAIWAERSSPHYHAAAMDGYALRSADTEGVSDRSPRLLKLQTVCIYLDTGDPLPVWCDAVLPVEVVERVEEAKAIRIYQSVPPWQHVRPMGEDIVATELILPAGHTIRAIDLGAIAAGGHAQVRVVRKPKVAVLPTGSELVPPDAQPEPGQIPEFNSFMLVGQIESWGGSATRWPILPDDAEGLKTAVSKAGRSHDLVCIIAGSSAGSEDFTAAVLQSLGEVLVHGIAVRPGHPVILGVMKTKKDEDDAQCKHVPVIGVPGYPVSAALTGELFVQPLIQRWLGQAPMEGHWLDAILTRKLHSTAGDEEHVRVTLGSVRGRWVATPLSRGAGVITSLVRADGILVVPAGSQGIQANERVKIRLIRSLEELEHTILALGSHDLTLDLLAQFLASYYRRLSSNNIGSIGGLIALGRGENHIAGAHLLDPESGEYNVPYVRQYLPDIPVTLVGLVMREQGLIIPPGNPKTINSLSDLERDDLRFVNRQKGSGTRLLLDHHLQRVGIASENIVGYEQEEYTHLTLASAVASGKADCGLGIRAAAVALGLGFIPLDSERFDLIIPTEFIANPRINPIFDVLQDPAFKAAVESLEGYDTRVMGEALHITPSE